MSIDDYLILAATVSLSLQRLAGTVADDSLGLRLWADHL